MENVKLCLKTLFHATFSLFNYRFFRNANFFALFTNFLAEIQYLLEASRRVMMSGVHLIQCNVLSTTFSLNSFRFDKFSQDTKFFTFYSVENERLTVWKNENACYDDIPLRFTENWSEKFLMRAKFEFNGNRLRSYFKFKLKVCKGSYLSVLMELNLTKLRKLFFWNLRNFYESK